MAEREVRYCTTEDGVRVAYCVEGEGPALLWLPEPQSSHLQQVRKQPWAAPIYSGLAEAFALAEYDARGLGLSDRNVADLTLAARVSDVEAVSTALRMSRFALMGLSLSATVAVAFAAKHPAAVSHLILIDWVPRTADLFAEPKIQAVAGLLAQDWEMFTENISSLRYGWSGERAREVARFLRHASDQQGTLRSLAATAQYDATDLLPRIACPTLVIWHNKDHAGFPEGARALAAQIRRARAHSIEASWGERNEELVSVIADFLGQDLDTSSLAEQPAPVAALRAVLFTDLVGHTEMMQRLGDEAGRDVLREHERITRDVLQEHGGVEVKTMGDGFMASFGSVTKAVECAAALQRAFDAWNHGEGQGGPDPRPLTPDPLLVRVGLNAGEPIAEEDDLFGSSVMLAARIAAQAQGGQILASVAVRELAMGKGFLFSDRGETALRGFEDPVRLYEVRWRE